MPSRRSRKLLYYAKDATALANGTFLKKSRYGLSRYVLGDFQGMINPWVPGDLDGLLVFDRITARKILPAACV